MNEKFKKEINKTTDLISSLIHEYFYKKDYPKTLNAFQQELSTKIKSRNFYSLPETSSLFQNTLISCFKSGEKQKFLSQWECLIPNHLILTEQTLYKLNFNIQIYFAIFPLLNPKANINDEKIKKKLEQNMEEFKTFLEQNKIEEFNTTEILAYYALPYIPDPRNNATYANLFSTEWSKCLEEQIEKCVEYYSPNNLSNLPILYDIVRGKKVITINNNINNNLKNYNNKKDEKKIKELIKENNELKEKDEINKKVFVDSQKNWSSLALDIINCSFDLVDICHKLNKNNKNEIIEDINNKLIKYQNFLLYNLDQLEKNKTVEKPNIISKKEFMPKDKFDLNNTEENNNNNKNKNITHSFPSNEEIITNNIEVPKLEINSQLNNIKNNNNNISIKIKTFNNDIIHKNHIWNNNYVNKNTNTNIIKPFEQKKKNSFKYNIKDSIINMKKLNLILNSKHPVYNERISHIFKEIREKIYSKDNTIRLITLYQIFFYDILGTLSNNSTFKQLISNKSINLDVMKLVNSLANYNIGKNYLLSKISIIDDIFKCMISENTDTPLRQNCLGALQKFTLRNEPQNKLIELNVIHYLIDIFSFQSEILSDYSIEYGLALLMNLSLRKEGKGKFEAVGEKIINILIKYLKYENIEILTCINGMLYSLLKKKKIREIAKEKGVEGCLEELKKLKNEQINRQIKYINDEMNKFNDNNENNDIDKDDLFVEEDIHIKDNIDTIFNEYPDNKIYDDSYIEKHNKIMKEYLIEPKSELEINEKNKINKFMNENLNMTKVLLMTNSYRSNDSDEININNNKRIKTEENSNEENEEDINKNNNIIINDYENNFDEIYERPDDGFAFKTQDKIRRTPPRNYS